MAVEHGSISNLGLLPSLRLSNLSLLLGSPYSIPTRREPIPSKHTYYYDDSGQVANDPDAQFVVVAVKAPQHRQAVGQETLLCRVACKEEPPRDLRVRRCDT